MGNYAVFYMFENPRRVRQARNFTTNVPKIRGLKSPSRYFPKIEYQTGQGRTEYEMEKRNLP